MSACPAEAVQGLLSWAQAERPHVALVIASGFLSNAAKDYLRDYEQNNRPPFRIKYWERPTVNELAWQHPSCSRASSRAGHLGRPRTPSTSCSAT